MASVSHALKSANGTNTHRHHTVPKRLNNRWPIEARLAATLPLNDASIGVTVVPILLPKTRAQARSNVIQPLLHIISTMANVAADDCIIMVRTTPTRQKISTERKPIDAYWRRYANISGLLCKSGT